MNKTIILLTVFFVTILSCQKKECACDIDPKVLIENDSIINEALRREFMDYDGKPFVVDSSKNHYERYWKKFDEPLLGNQKNESYRFSISFLLYNYFKVYRVEKKNNKYKSEIKIYARCMTSGCRGDSLVSQISKEISKIEWQEITNVLEENCFWTMATDIKSDDNYLDGSSWSLEGFKNYNNCTSSSFHAVGRASPDSSGFTVICEKIMELDSLEVQEFY